MKRRLVVSMDIEFNHEESTFSGSMPGADYELARGMAIAGFACPKGSLAMEEILFNNSVNFQTRILAIYILGTLRGQVGPRVSVVEIKPQDPTGGSPL